MSVAVKNSSSLYNKTVAFHTLGCKVNAYESDSMEESLKAAGLRILPFTEKADIYVINTCSVTNIADRKSRQMLSRARKMNPDALIVATGCYVQLMADRDRRDMVKADILLGNNDKDKIVDVLEAWFITGSVPEIIPAADDRTYCPLTLKRPQERMRAYLKVQDGCDQFCSYCIIPYGRGRTRSREIEDVVREAETMAKSGVKEFVLTGIHLSSYGLEKEGTYNDYMKSHEVQEELIKLIEALHEVPGVRRLRLGSLEPRLMTEGFVSRLALLKKLCPQFHLSLQSGCDATLQRMNRHYTAEDFRKSCETIRKYFTYPALTCDVIVGFPGETEEEFNASRQFIEEIGFSQLHVFPYSKREGTKAASMKDQVPDDVKKERSEILLMLSLRLQRKYEEALEGKTVEVLTEEEEEREGETWLTGYTKEYVRVYVPGDHEVNEILNGVLKRTEKGCELCDIGIS